MADFPDAVYAPRTKENLPGIVYDAAKKTIGYVEDITKLDDEVVAIETELGVLPKWASASIKERLKGIRSLSDAEEDVLVVKEGNVGIGIATPLFKLSVAGKISLNTGSVFDMLLSTQETPGTFGRTELLAKPSGANVTYPAVKFIIDTGGTGILANESSFLVLAKGGTDVGQFGINNNDLYFDARLNPSNIIFRNDTNQTRIKIKTGGNIEFLAGAITQIKSLNNYLIHSIKNANAGALAQTLLELSNGGTLSHSIILRALGTGYTTVGGFVQDGGTLETGSNLLGGLSIMTRADAPIRFYTNGHTNERMRILSGGNVGIGVTDPHSKLEVNGAISSATLEFSDVGPTDDLDVAGVNTLFINAGANAVTIGGFVGGVDGQILNIVIIDPTNNVTLEHAEGGGNQDILLHAGADETLDGHYGGWTLVCHAGVDWHDASHAKHV